MLGGDFMLKGFTAPGEESGPWLGDHKELSLPCPSVHSSFLPQNGASVSAAALAKEMGVFW